MISSHLMTPGQAEAEWNILKSKDIEANFDHKSLENEEYPHKKIRLILLIYTMYSEEYFRNNVDRVMIDNLYGKLIVQTYDKLETIFRRFRKIQQRDDMYSSLENM